MPSLRSEHLTVYRDIVRLLWRYADRDLVERAGMSAALTEGEPSLDRAGDPEDLARDLEAMGPTFIKLGQLLSTRADLLPPDYLAALSTLQDDVEPVPFEEVQRIVAEELDVRISNAFSSFDEEPLASASLAQVHAATLRDGRRIAVKVQRPGIRARIATDLEALSEIADLLERHSDTARHFNIAELVEEFRRTLMRELDFQREAQNLRTMRANLEDNARIVIPEPVDDYTTPRVLTMELIEGKKVTELGELGRMEIPGEELADALFAAYLEQILAHGFLHADPHPGNVFITADREHVALLDLGMVAHLSPKRREQLLQLLFAVVEARIEEAVEAAISIGEKDADFDEEALRTGIAEIVTRFGEQTVADIEVGAVVMEVSRVSAQAGLRPPADLALLAKALMNLDEVGRTLDPQFDPNAAVERHAADLVSRQMWRSLSPTNLIQALIATKDLVEQMPSRINAIMERLAEGEFKVKVDSIDEDRLIAGLYQVANRIATGLVLAALIIGAAMLMGVETEATILGYPALPMVFFLIAAVGGLLFVFGIVFGGSKPRR
jgi:ubiquinone biosynthesis protein